MINRSKTLRDHFSVERYAW